MTIGTEAASRAPAIPSMSGFERYLSVWVLLCIVTGIALGQSVPGVFQAVGHVPARIDWTRFCASGGLSQGMSLTGFER